MDLPPLDVPGLLHQFHLRPDKRLGQNFLTSSSALVQVVQAAGLERGDAVLEIGPGVGSLTRILAANGGPVVAVEIDADLIPLLRQVLRPFPNVRLVQGDALALNPSELVPASDYQVVANIPYYITSALIRHLLEASVRPRRITLTVQKEVAARICAGPGDMSLLSLSVQVYGRPRQVAQIPAGAFYPVPSVDSAVVRVDLYPEALIPPEHLPGFFRLAKAGFSQKRKNLRNSLSGGMGWKTTQAESLLSAAGIDPKRRAETLSLEEWSILLKNL